MPCLRKNEYFLVSMVGWIHRCRTHGARVSGTQQNDQAALDIALGKVSQGGGHLHPFLRFTRKAKHWVLAFPALLQSRWWGSKCRPAGLLLEKTFFSNKKGSNRKMAPAPPFFGHRYVKMWFLELGQLFCDNEGHGAGAEKHLFSYMKGRKNWVLMPCH